METKRDLSGLRNEVRELDKHFIKWYRLLMDISKRVQQSIQKRNGI